MKALQINAFNNLCVGLFDRKLLYNANMLGKLLDRRYRIIRELAEGGFSQTYLAEDTRLPKNPQCVVKHLNPTIDDPVFTQKALELFKAEAETLQELGKHDLIPQLYAYFQENKEFYLVQEFIAGHPLSKEMSPGSQMAEARVAQIIKEVLEILQFVHKYNVIHRDIKPSNLIRRHSDGKLVLIDFGTVKQVQMEVASAHHKAKVTLPIGTPGYMPSEQAHGEPKFASDIYAIGMIGIQALTGIPPSHLAKDDNLEILWRASAPKVYPEFADILSQMVRFDFRQRYPSAEASYEAIREFVDRDPVSHVNQNLSTILIGDESKQRIPKNLSQPNTPPILDRHSAQKKESNQYSEQNQEAPQPRIWSYHSRCDRNHHNYSHGWLSA